MPLGEAETERSAITRALIALGYPQTRSQTIPPPQRTCLEQECCIRYKSAKRPMEVARPATMDAFQLPIEQILLVYIIMNHDTSFDSYRALLRSSTAGCAGP